MTWYEIAVFALNLVGAVVAFVVNTLAAGKRGLPSWRSLHTAVATLAAIYVGGYLWFLIERPTVELWSSIFRGVALVAWPVCWTLPAVITMRTRRQLHKVVEEYRSEPKP